MRVADPHERIRDRVRPALTAAAAAAGVVVLAFASGGYFPSEWGLLLLAFALVLFGAAVGASASRSAGSTRSSSPRWRRSRAGSCCRRRGHRARTARCSKPSARSSTSPPPRRSSCAETRARVRAPGRACGRHRDRRVGGPRRPPSRRRLGDPADPVSGIRLDDPIGYANAVGILVVLGALLIAALALRAATFAAAAAGAALVPLASALAFTFSRGALVGLVAGSLSLILLEWERGRAFAGLVLARGCASGRSAALRPLTAGGGADAAGQADAAGERLLWQLPLLCALGAAVGAVVPRARECWRPTWSPPRGSAPSRRSWWQSSPGRDRSSTTRWIAFAPSRP